MAEICFSKNQKQSNGRFLLEPGLHEKKAVFSLLSVLVLGVMMGVSKTAPTSRTQRQAKPCSRGVELFLGRKASSRSKYIAVVVVHSLCHVQIFATPCTAARQASLSSTNSWSLLKLMSIESVMPPKHLIFCHPLLLLPSIFVSFSLFQ